MADRFPLIIDNSAEKIKELVSGDNLDLTKSNLKNADYIQSAGVNVAGVATATSLIGDGSQLTNLPPSGGTLEATASGTLANGSKVIVNTDGTVSVVAQSETSGSGVGSAVVYNSATTYQHTGTYDSINGKVIVTYADNSNSNYGTAIVGTVSGTSISFGSAVVFESGITEYITPIYDSTNGKVVIAYRDSGNSYYGTAVVGTVSGTSISFGTPVVFESSNSYNISATFDSTNSKVVIGYTDYPNSQYGTAIVGTVSGTSISFGSPVVFESAETSQISVGFDSTNGKVVIAYVDYGNSQYGTAIVGTVSGTSISFGSPTVFNTALSEHTSVTYDSTNNKVVIGYQDAGNSYYGTAIVGTVSGTSISFGSEVVFYSGLANYISAVFDSTNGKVVIAYQDNQNSLGLGKVVSGTVSGTSISFGTTTTFYSGNTQTPSAIFDSSSGKVVIAYGDNPNSNYGTAVVFGTTGFSIPQLGSAAVFESSNTMQTSPVYDPINQKVIIAYRDGGNSHYGTAIIGTVSGTSISFGTPVIFNSGGTALTPTSAVYDSANQKVVIAYQDGNNSWRGTAIVGTVSGTSISFGSPTAFNSSNQSDIGGAVYDSTNQKVVIGYRDYGNSFYGTAVVGTVSGTSISFGSSSVFNYSDTYQIKITYDSTNGKVVIVYDDYGNSRAGTAIVGTVSGTSISFGSESVFNSTEVSYQSATYDSTNGKVVIAFRDEDNSQYGKAIVGTVSGTSISFGSPVTFESANVYNIAATYDTSNDKVVIAYRDLGNSGYGTFITGTVSGTSISFGSPVVFNSGTSEEMSITFDSSNGKVIISYQDGGDSNYGKAVVFSPITMATNLTSENYIGISDGAYSNGQTATVQIIGAVDDAQSSLTPGQAYYVQDDGTLAESGSVFAGTAIAATKLIVRG